MRETDDLVEFENSKCKRETDKALLVSIDGGEDLWLPKSQIHDSSEVQAEDDEGTLIISEWLAREKGLL